MSPSLSEPKSENIRAYRVPGKVFLVVDPEMYMQDGAINAELKSALLTRLNKGSRSAAAFEHGDYIIVSRSRAPALGADATIVDAPHDKETKLAAAIDELEGSHKLPNFGGG